MSSTLCFHSKVGYKTESNIWTNMINKQKKLLDTENEQYGGCQREMGLGER